MVSTPPINGYASSRLYGHSAASRANANGRAHFSSQASQATASNAAAGKARFGDGGCCSIPAACCGIPLIGGLVGIGLAIWGVAKMIGGLFSGGGNTN